MTQQEQRDGWSWAADDLRAAVLSDDLGVVHASGTALGESVARFHLDRSFTTRPSTAEDVAGWIKAGQRDLDDALRTTRVRDAGKDAYALLRRHEATIRSVLALPGVLPGPPVMLSHGELSVSRILRSGRTLRVVEPRGGAVVVPPAADVAAVAQSLSHAAMALLRYEPDQPAALIAAARQAFVAAFLTSYGMVLDDAGAPGLLDDELLHPLRVRNVCRTLSHTARHEPDSMQVPMSALPELLA